MTTHALRQALVQHEAFVHELALVLTRNPAEADDVAQEVLLRTLERGQGAGIGLRAWLASSTRRVAWNMRRAERRRTAREQRVARPEAHADPTAALAARQQLVDAVLALDEPFRRTVILVHEQGLTASEVGAREGVPPGTVRTRLHRAHGLLRKRLEARGLDRSALSALVALGRAPALRVNALAGVAGAVAVGAVALAGALAWTSRGRHEDVRLVSNTAVALERSADETVAPLAAAPPVAAPDERLASVHAPLARVPALDEHPYWAAVRAARDQITRYDEDPRSDLSRVVVEAEALPLPIDEPVGLELSDTSPIVAALRRALQSEETHTVRVSDKAVKRAAERGVNVRRATRGVATSLPDLLDVVVELAGPDIGWDVVDGTLWIATWEELAAQGTSFEFALDDFLVVPGDHGTPVPYPIFERALGVAELRGLLAQHLPLAFGDVVVEESERGLVVVHTPRVLREIQTWLDSFRAFWVPLPEAGVPGRTLRFPRGAADERVLKALRAEGGPERIVPEQGRSLTERWRQFGERHGVAVLWTAGALEIDAQRSAAIESGAPLEELERALRLDVLGGSLIIRAAHEPSSARSLSTALFDLRPVLTGAAATRAQIERHPALARFAQDGETFTLAMQPFEDLVRTEIAPGSWDEDSRTHAMLSRCPTLMVRHTPWVIDDIDALIEALR